MTNPHLRPVALDKAYRLMNLGSTTLVSARAEGADGIMPATWACPLDLSPTKATVVIDSTHFTRPLVEKSGYFALQLPCASIVREVMHLGTVSKNDDPEKIEKSGVKCFEMPGYDLPLVEGCAGWIIFKVIPEPHNEKTYDLFIGEAVAAWADDRVFTDGHWHLEEVDLALRPLHYVAGGHFYATGEPVVVPEYGTD